jgi:hypothetical protein
MKPVPVSKILRKVAPREALSRFAHQNRYDNLRDNSPAPSERTRSDSVSSQKRKVSESDNLEKECQYVKTKVCKLTDAEEEEMVIIDSKISKVSTLCGKMFTAVQQQQLDVDDPLRALLADILEAVKVTNEVQASLSEKYKSMRTETVSIVDENAPLSYSYVAGGDGPPQVRSSEGRGKSAPQNKNQRRKPAGGLVQMGTSQQVKVSEKPAETDEEKKARKFSEAIRDAERSTLCFNLNMGNVPLMNKTTISEKASLALAKMAASAENKFSSTPSADAIAAIDDVTSMVTNMEFYGSSTKEYKGKDSTGFCTVPVRYQFKDKEQKFFAEKTLREICKVKCATPYPAIVRECIKQVVNHVRASHPNDFVKVSVLTKEFALKVARRPPGKDNDWIVYPDSLRLPDEALDVSTKQVPKGLRMFYLPSEGNDEMLTSPIRKETAKSPSKAGKGENTKK